MSLLHSNGDLNKDGVIIVASISRVILTQFLSAIYRGPISGNFFWVGSYGEWSGINKLIELVQSGPLPVIYRGCSPSDPFIRPFTRVNWIYHLYPVCNDSEDSHLVWG